MRLPAFLIIGAAKSGTTTLYEYLSRHPQVYMCTPKEPDFFSIDEHYEKGIDWYRSLFSLATPNQICGEASTTYTRQPQYPQAAARIAKSLPAVKLIYIVRHPIDRAYSHHVHEIKCGEQKPCLPFEEGIKQRSYLVESGNYIAQLEPYRNLFSSDQLLLLLMEDLIKKPDAVLAQVRRFLGIDDVDLIQDQPVLANQGRQHAEGFVRSKMTAPLKAIPGVARTAALLPQGVRDSAYQMLKNLPLYGEWGKKQTYLPPAMLPQTRQRLIDKFREPNLQLAKILNRDLSHWNR